MHVKEEWKLYTNHKFVKQLLDNKLEKKSFLDYLIQDYLFLYQFSKAWSLAIVKADNPKKEMKLCAETVNQLINFEMSLHEEILQHMALLKKLRNTDEKNKI